MVRSFFRKLTRRFFVLTNIAVAVIFLIGCNVKYFDPQTWWILGFLTTASFYLMAILVIFFFIWLVIKPVYVIISLVALLLAYKPIQNIIPFRVSSTFPQTKAATNTRIMSWNVCAFDLLTYSRTHKRKVFDSMVALINKFDPDIACFQEMVASDTVVPQLKHLSTLTRSLHFAYHFYTYNPEENWFFDLHFGTITYSKYPIINHKTIRHEPNDYNSMFQYVDIVKNNDTLRVFNIHLESLHFTDNNFKYLDKSIKDETVNIDQSKPILQKMKYGFAKRQRQADWIKQEINNSPYPVIICGDLNDVPNSYAYATIGEGLKNAFEEKGSGIGRTFSSISPTLRIDNIFVDKRFTVEQYTRVKKRLSDHFPIFADISTKKE
jgi:endonuclease/exonuclease/phosphatase family metal-dependent hydrolase